MSCRLCMSTISTSKTVSQPIDWSVDWFVSRSIQLIHWSVDPLVSQLIAQSIHWSVNRLVSQSIRQSIDSSIDPLVSISIGQSVDWSVDGLVSWSLVGLLIGQLIHWSQWSVDGLVSWLVSVSGHIWLLTAAAAASRAWTRHPCVPFYHYLLWFTVKFTFLVKKSP